MNLRKKIYNTLYQWEYRPVSIFRIPLYFMWLPFAIKAKHPFFFSIVNSGVIGGFMTETKSSVYTLLPKNIYPITIEILFPCDIDSIKRNMMTAGLSYPVVIKPDGDSVRGTDVYIIENESDWEKYLHSIPAKQYLIQEFVDGEEYSIFYYRYPDEKIGHILGMTKKIYPSVVGDGKSTLYELLSKDDRYKRYIGLFRDTYKISLETVLTAGEKKQIAVIGNHSKGSLFWDWSTHSNDMIVGLMDEVFTDEVGIHLCRLDIKTPSREFLLRGEYKILEVNCGVFSEPTYMYDPNYKLIDAYKQLYKVRYHTYKIATYNHQKNNIPYMTLHEGRKNIMHFLKK